MEEFKKTPRSLSYRGEALEQIPLTGTTSVPEGGAHPQKRRSGSLIRGFSVLLFAAALAGAYLDLYIAKTAREMGQGGSSRDGT